MKKETTLVFGLLALVVIIASVGVTVDKNDVTRKEAELNYKAKLAAYGCNDYNGVVVCPPKNEDAKECSYDR